MISEASLRIRQKGKKGMVVVVVMVMVMVMVMMVMVMVMINIGENDIDSMLVAVLPNTNPNPNFRNLMDIQSVATQRARSRMMGYVPAPSSRHRNDPMPGSLYLSISMRVHLCGLRHL